MISRIGEKFTDLFQKYMPDSFVFALLLTLIVGICALIFMGSSPIDILIGWYDGFWELLEFGMQLSLIIVTGFSIALSPIIRKGIDNLTKFINTPRQVYFFVCLIALLLSVISWGWIVVAAVLARELALRVKGVNYPYLIACVYISNISWVTGLASTIPLLLNTENNYLIEGGILENTIPTALTLGSTLNISMMILLVVLIPILMTLFVPKTNIREIGDMLINKTKGSNKEETIEEEADSLKLPFKAVSDTLNNTSLIQWTVSILGLIYVVYYFATKGLDLNLNIMIFIFIMLGLLLHKTPVRYGIAMRKASSNVSGILFQFPFYAGIMGIMTFTGLGEEFAKALASVATIDTYPFFSYLIGGVVNFAIPSGGGEFAVIGPSVIEAVNNIGTSAGLAGAELTQMTARASLSIAYGECLTNLLQPFFLLLVIPVMGAGIKIQARDVMGYLVLPFLIFFIAQTLMVTFIPL